MAPTVTEMKAKLATQLRTRSLESGAFVADVMSVEYRPPFDGQDAVESSIRPEPKVTAMLHGDDLGNVTAAAMCGLAAVAVGTLALPNLDIALTVLATLAGGVMGTSIWLALRRYSGKD